MAIFGQVKKQDYTHYGWFGLCPIYIRDPDHVCPDLVERNWVPEWWLAAQEYVQGTYIFFRSLVDDDYEPEFAIVVSGEIQ